MKLGYLLVLLLFLSACDNAETIDSSDLVNRNGLFYKKSTNVPFTGKTSGVNQGTFKDGKGHGLFEMYHKNGRLLIKRTLKNGKKHGPFEDYYQNGQLWKKGTFKDGKLVNKVCFTKTGATTPC